MLLSYYSVDINEYANESIDPVVLCGLVLTHFSVISNIYGSFFSFVNETTHTLATSVVSGMCLCMCAVFVILCRCWLEANVYKLSMNGTLNQNKPNDGASQSIEQNGNMSICVCVVVVVEMSWSFSFVNCRFKCESREKSEFTQKTLSFCLSRVFSSLQLTRSHFCELSTPKNWLVTHLFSSDDQISQSK